MAVHLELRDSYMRDDPDFVAWLQGWRPDPDEPRWREGYYEAVAQAVKRGVEVRRIRVVSEPLSDYARYEYDLTFANVAAGEQVRWLPRASAPLVLLPAMEGWVMDADTLVLHHFSGEGQWTGDGMELRRDPDMAHAYARALEGAWHSAIPHADYRPV